MFYFSYIKSKLDFELLSKFSHDKLKTNLEGVKDPAFFVKALFETIIKEPSASLIKIIHATFLIQNNFLIKEEVQAYFGLPIFANLSEARLLHEIDLCQDQRLGEAVSNVSSALNIGNDPLIIGHKSFFFNFIELVKVSIDVEFVEASLELLTLLLLQPSCRRFVKPLMEDSLFLSFIKSKMTNNIFIDELESVFYYPIDEISGVSFNSPEEYTFTHFSKIRSLQAKILDIPELSPLARMPLNYFTASSRIFQCLIQLPSDSLRLILLKMGCAGFPQNFSNEVLIDAITMTLLLRSINSTDDCCVFPTEVIT